jgi:hypothetical protein
MCLSDNVKKEIISKLIDIIVGIKDNSWINIDNNIKIKIIHHFCNLINVNNPLDTQNVNNSQLKIIIPLKSNKPKKIIEFSGINKNYNNVLFQDYNKKILNYTFDFRDKYLNCKNRIYYTFNNLPKKDYQSILDSYNSIVYDFIISSKKNIKTNKFYSNIIGNNSNKLIIENNLPKDFIIQKKENFLNITFDNGICINMELFFVSDKITKNIPVKYNIKLLNQF